MKYYTLLLIFTIAYGYHTMLQLSDFHFDPCSYADCPAELFGCCRKSSLPFYSYRLSGKYGDERCGSPYSLINDTLYWIKNYYDTHQEYILDAILFTGDIPDHSLNILFLYDTTHPMSIIADLLYKIFPNIPIIPAIGNHDSFPLDQLPSFLPHWYFKIIYEIWKPSIPDYSYKYFMKGGYYYTDVINNNRIIVLNCLWVESWNVLSPVKDPADQIQWLEYILHKTKLEKKKAIILNHIPLYSYEFAKYYSKKVESILDRYWDVVTAVISGHTHHPEVRVIKDENRHPFVINYVGGSIKPNKQRSMFRIYEFNYDSFHIENILDFDNDLSRSNVINSVNYLTHQPMKEYLGMPDLTPKSWLKIFYYMYDNSTLFDRYMKIFEGMRFKTNELTEEQKEWNINDWIGINM